MGDGSAKIQMQKRKHMQFKHVTLEIDGAVAVITLDHQ